MKNLKNIITENKPLIGTVYAVSCWYGFCYLAGKGTSALIKEHFDKHPTSKGKVVVASAAATVGVMCLANFIGDLVGESIGRNFFKEPKKLEVIKNDPEEDLGDMDDSEVV
jgi:hypothetical protein